MLLGEIDRELMHYIPGVAAQCAKEGAIPIHNDEAEFLVRFEQLTESLGMKFIVT